MGITKDLPTDQWQDRFPSLTYGNKQRMTSIITKEGKVVEGAPFVRILFDPVGKGDRLFVTLENFSHVIEHPVEIYITKKSNGQLSSLEITDENGDSTFVNFE